MTTIASTLPAGATSLLTEDFAYTAGTALTANGWTAHNSGGATPNTQTVVTPSPALTYSGYLSGGGNAASLVTSGEDTNRTFATTSSGSVYAAFLVNASAAQTAGDYFFHLNQSTTIFYGRVYIKKDSASAKFAFGLGKSNETTPQYTGFNYDIGTTYLVVVKYTFNTGTTTDDTLNLYVNPSLGGSEPSASLGPVNTTNADSTGLIAVGLRQGSAANAATVKVDGIRIATTWAEAAASSGATPTIVGAATATAFTTTYGTASVTQTFSVSGSNLTADITATAPTGFEVASDGSTYGSTATFTQSGGAASGTLSVRLKANAAVTGTYNSQSVALSSSGAATVNITTAASGNAVSPAALSVTGISGVAKTYDGSAAASLTGTAAYSGLVNGEVFEVVSGTPVATFASANAGTAVAITVSGYTAPSTNYTVTQPTGLTADINPKALTVTADNVTKPFGTTLTSGAGKTAFTSSGLVDPETIGSVTLTYTAGGASTDEPGSNPGAIQVSDATGGTFLLSNYAVTYVAGNLTVTASPTISVSGTLTAVSTPYGTASATPASFTVSGANLTSDITVTAPAAFEVSTTVGTGYSSSLVLTASGNAVTDTTIYVRLTASNPAGTYSGNVVVTSNGATTQNVATAPSNVTPLSLTVTGLTGVDKVYDGNLSATVTGTPELNGVLVADTANVTLAGTATASFGTKTVGTAKSITVTGYTLSGSAAGNYAVTQPTGITASITPLALTVTGAAVTTKPFDGNTNATITGTLSGVISPDVVTLVGTGSYASSAIGTGIAVTASCTLSGADAGNYSVVQPTGLTGSISNALPPAETVAYWNFNTLSIAAPSAPGTGGVPTSITASQGTGTISLTGYAGTVEDFAGSTLNVLGSDPAEESLSLVVGGTAAPFPANGSYIEIQLNLADFANPVVSFATRGTASGFTTGAWSYSVAGGAFTTIAGVNTASTTSTFALAPTVDLTSINAVDGQSNVRLRYTVSGGTSSTGNNRIDNLLIVANRTSDSVAPVASTFSPADNATNAPITSTPSIVFNEPVQKGTTGNILIKRSSDDSIFETIAVTSSQVSVSGSTLTISPSVSFAYTTGYYVEVPAGAVEDLAGNDYPGVSGNAAWNFTTIAPAVLPSATETFTTQWRVLPSGASASADYYAEGNGQGNFARFDLGVFNLSKLDFGLSGASTITSVSTAEFTLTHNDRTFTQGTEVEFFFTTDAATGKSFNAALVNGIDNSQFSFAPISLGKFAYTPEAGGSTDTFTLDLSAAGSALVSRLNTGEDFSIIIAATTPMAAITYSGKGNTFDPGDPSLKLTVNETTGVDTTAPTVAFFTPADGSGGLPISSNIKVSFNELVQKGTSGTISILRLADNSVFETINVTSSQVTVNLGTVTIDPVGTLESAGNYYVNISVGAIEDVSSNDFAGIADNTTWNFSTAQPPITAAGPFTISQNAPAGTVVGKLNNNINGKEGIKYTMLSGSGGSTLMKAVPGAGYVVNPVFTIGDTIESATGALNASSAGNFSPVGTPDGLGAFSLNANTVRVFMNHEVEVPTTGNAGYPFTLSNGTVMSKGGARVSYFDIDKASRRVIDGGLAIARIYDRSGNVVTSTSQLELGGLDRMCSASLYEPNLFGTGRGLVDRIYITGEETSTAFGHPHGGTYWALDTSNGDFWALPDMGRGSWENAALIDTGTTTHVAFLLGDDAQSTPLYLYVGMKDTAVGANFLQRNGLSGGQLYVWKAANGNTTPQQFNGTGSFRTGSWVAINAKNAAAAGTAGHDAAGYKNDTTLQAEADSLGAFSFSRPEDLSTSPTDGSIVAFTSTGRGSLYPLDNWGDTYVLDIDFAAGVPTSGFLRIVYSGDDAGNGQFMSPEEGLRCPDNLDWADDGSIYVQEDQSNQVGSFGAAGEETSIWRLDISGDYSDNNQTNVSAQVTRVAQTDRSTVLPLGSADGNTGDFGNWESSGIIDVSSLFGEAAGTLFLFDVQAHSITNGLISSKTLFEGGQLCFLERGLEKGAFKLNPNTGVITLANPDALDYLAQPSHELRLQAFDGTNHTLDQITINVTNTAVAATNNFKVATFNTSHYRDTAGALINDLATVNNTTSQSIARIIQRNNADVILLNEFDYDEKGVAIRRFQENYLEVGQSGENPVYYPYVFIAPANTGVASGFDLDNNGTAVTTRGATGYGEDALGFGLHPGQYSFVVLSKYPIDTPNIRTFQKFLWKDMPNAQLPDNPNIAGTGDWYSAAELNVFRLSSKNHADVPVLVNGTPVHILASHPTPPVFDDPGSGTPWIAGVDHNGRRNSDEIRFWSDYINPSASSYIYDDTETSATPSGGLPANTRFVICGDQNADNNEGDSSDPAIKQLIGGVATVGGATIPANPFVNSSFVPAGGAGPNADDTAAFSGGVRVDYALPSAFGLTVNNGGVFWPASNSGDPIVAALSATDHYMVYLNLTLSGVSVPPATDLATYYAPAQGLTGSALQAALHNVIDDHTVIDYGNVDDVMQVIDEAAPGSDQVRLLYSNATLPKTSNNIAGGWNREHVWPRSDGVGDEGPDYSDVHHLFPSKDSVNSLRSNLPYDESANLDSDPFAPESFKDNDSWEPLDRDKGIVARAQLYMMTRYDGAEALTTDLVLADNTSPTGTQGVLSTLLAWHRAFPPTDYERARNNAIYAGVTVGGTTYAQGNRNPFIDFPQFVDAIFLNNTTTSFSKWQTQNFTLTQLSSSTSSSTGNPDADLLDNYGEFLFRGNPTTASNTPLVLAQNATTVTLTFHRPKGIAEVAKLQTSTTPNVWSDVSNWLASTTITDLGDYEQLVYSTNIAGLGATPSWRVIFVDGGLNTVATSNVVTATSGNQTPVVANVIASQSATKGVAFSFTVASNTFSDPESQPLTYTATKADNSALPAWLSFNAASRTFTGTPTAVDLGTTSIKVTATDNGDPIQSASTTFALQVVPASGSAYFPQSVASGDPRSSSVILWTRLMDGDTASDRSVTLHVTTTGAVTDVGTTVALGGTNVWTGGNLTALSAYDGVVKVKVPGLAADTTYYYQFAYNGQRSPVGRTKTAPAAGSTRAVKYAAINCNDYVGRYFNVLRHLTEREQDTIDFVLNLGDYVYETTGDASFQTTTPDRAMVFSNPGEAINLGSGNYAAQSLGNYRDIYKTIRQDPQLQRVHELFPMISIWDDHEFSDDNWKDNATYFDGKVNEQQTARKRNGEKAWMEFLPTERGLAASGTALEIDASDLYPNTVIYDAFNFGTNLDLILSDIRTNRADHLIPEDAFPATIAMDESAVIATLAAVYGVDVTTFTAAVWPGLEGSFSPYVNIDAPANATIKGVLQAIVAGGVNASLASLPAGQTPVTTGAAYAAAKVTGLLDASFVNQTFQAAGQAAPFDTAALAAMDRGLSFYLLGKTGFFSDFGSRYQVVDQTFKLYAGYTYQAFIASGGALGRDQAFYNTAQQTFLATALGTSSAAGNKWRVVASSTPYTPIKLELGDLPSGVTLPTQGSISGVTIPASLPSQFLVEFLLNADEPAGFPQFRQGMLDLFAQHDTIIVSGDIHAQLVGNNAASNGQKVVDFTVPSAASSEFRKAISGAFSTVESLMTPSVQAATGLPGAFSFDSTQKQAVINATDEIIKHNTPEMFDADTATHGYTVFTASASDFNAEYRKISVSDIDDNLYALSASALSSRFSSESYGVVKTGSGAASDLVITTPQAPTDIALSSTEVADGSAANTTVGTLSATDANAGDTHSFSLVSGEGSTDNGSFAIVGNALKITTTVNAATKSSYSVRVRATDSSASVLSFEEAFTITVTAPGSVSFALANVGVNKTEASVTLSLTRTGGTAATSVLLSTTDGTALAGVDYTGKTDEVVSFAANSNTATVTINLSAAAITSSKEFTATISSNGAATLGATTTATVRIKADTTAPTVAVTAPGNNATVKEPLTTTAKVTISGTITGDSTDTVSISINGGAAIPATRTGSNAWSVTFTGTTAANAALVGGNNTVVATATDLDGNVGTSAPRTFFYEQLRDITVTSTNGTVTFVPGLVAGKAAVGKLYTLSAKPNVAFFFSSWTGTAGFSSTTTSSTTFTFVEANNTVTANFVASPFNLAGGVNGTYNGIVKGSAAADTQANAGILNVLVALNTGAFTGKLNLDGNITPVAGVFNNVDGTFVTPTVSNGVVYNLDLDFTTKVITGTITKRKRGADVSVVNVNAPQAYTTAAFTPAVAYNVAFSAPDAPAELLSDEYPHGNGYGVLTISASAGAKLVGVLADGTAFTSSSVVCKPVSPATENTVPVYASFAAAKGALVGNATITAAAAVTGTDFRWFKSENSGQYYPYGFALGADTGLTIDIAAGGLQSAATAPTLTTVSFSGGGFASSSIAVGTNPKISFKPTTNVMSGSYTNASGSNLIGGIVVGSTAYGYILTPLPTHIDGSGQGGRVVFP